MTREEAIKAIKAWDFLDNDEKKVIETLIPELKKSEDEENIKDLIDELKCSLRAANCQNDACRGGHEKRIALLEWAIAWLEKKGESDETKAKMFLINKGYPIDANGVFPTYEEIYNIIRDGLEHQVEQKSIFDFNANNWCVSKVDGKIHNIYNVGVEPKFHKFHESDWVVCEFTGSVYQIKNCIENLSNHKYGYDLTNGGYIGSDEVNHYHLWTIADAKDGDVLDADGAPFIYKKHDKDYVYFYCGVNLADEFIEANEFDTWNNNNKVYPATKEQRDILFAKMKEAGYEWDSEKKELKILEKQEPKWTEEYEKYIETTISFLKDFADKGYENAVACIDWLKSIKPRIGG